MEATLIKHSLPKNLKSEPQLLCESCQVRLKMIENGETRKWCRVCIARWTKKQARQENANIDRLMVNIVNELFMHARLEQLSHGIQDAFSKLSEGRGMMLWGTAGVGKSHSMAAFVRHYITEGYNVEWAAWEMLCSRIRSSFTPKAGETEYGIIKSLIEPDIIFLDDVGTTVSGGVSETDFSRRVLESVLEQRLNRCKATFITSNKSVEQLSSSFDERVASRIQKICEIIQCKGKDRRAL